MKGHTTLLLSACLAMVLGAVPALSHAHNGAAHSSGEAGVQIEAPGQMASGPVQGSPAMRTLLASQRLALEALEARAEEPGGQERIASAQEAMEESRLELLATEAEQAGRTEEAALARAELARLHAPQEPREIRWQPRTTEVEGK